MTEKKAQFTVQELAQHIGGVVEGNGDLVIKAVASLESAGKDELSFLLDPRRRNELKTTQAGAVIVPKDHPPAQTTLICVDDVQAALSKVLELYSPANDLPAAGIHPSAVISDDADIAPTAAIGANVVIHNRVKIESSAIICDNVTIGSDVIIGAETIIYPGTVIFRRCKIGRDCRIGPNALIGSVGFGYYFSDGKHNRIPHAGWVEIGDEVDIGANSCVDRAKFGPTRIGDGTKIDNLVQIAHNVQIGKGCIIVAQTGIAGSAKLKDGVMLGGQVGIRDNIVIGSAVQAAACSCIAQDVPDGAIVAGIPATDAVKWIRGAKIIPELDKLRTKVRQLEKRLGEIESSTNH